ncbi:MAG: hypothetical protein ACOYY2_15785, partial [Actinomycetota bacterium]
MHSPPGDLPGSPASPGAPGVPAYPPPSVPSPLDPPLLDPPSPARGRARWVAWTVGLVVVVDLAAGIGAGRWAAVTGALDPRPAASVALHGRAAPAPSAPSTVELVAAAQRVFDARAAA